MVNNSVLTRLQKQDGDEDRWRIAASKRVPSCMTADIETA